MGVFCAFKVRPVSWELHFVFKATFVLRKMFLVVFLLSTINKLIIIIHHKSNTFISLNLIHKGFAPIKVLYEMP